MPLVKWFGVLAVPLLLAAADAPPPQGARFDGNPIIRSGMPGLSGDDGDNINGPSLIRVPAWIPKPLGRYYLYFAHHQGKYIRLAYAESLAGPWKIHTGGVLPLEESHFNGHIASPDVHIDGPGRRIVMYYHGHSKGGQALRQTTRVAVSEDGLRFQARAPELGPSYFRVFRWRGDYYALARAGDLLKARDPREPGKLEWELGPSPFAHFGARIPRHVALKLVGNNLQVFYSRIGDAPEHIMMSTIDMSNDWKSWRASDGMSVLRPEKEYEGARLPIVPSVAGLARGPVHELRDPAIFEEAGRTWLLYSTAGESGIALAELK